MFRVAAYRLQFAVAVPSPFHDATYIFVALALVPFPSAAQELTTASAPQTICNLAIPPPAQEPPSGVSPIIFQIVPCFDRQGNISMVEPETYLHHIQTPVSRPSRNEWVPYDAAAVDSILQDFKRLWATGFLDDLTIEAIDYPFANGAIGKLIVYRMEERQRIKIVRFRFRFRFRFDRRSDAAGAGRPSISHQPHFVHWQHDHARSGHPPRTAGI